MLRARWLGRVPYGEADQLQRALHERAADDYLLLLEHPHVYTLGTTADPAHVLVPPATVGAELVRRRPRRRRHLPRSRPARRLPDRHAARVARRPARRRRLRARSSRTSLIAALAGFGIDAHREPRYTGVWVGDEKIAAIGVKVARGRTRHGFALNVDPDLAMFDHIVPCGIRDRGVTSMAALLGAAPEMRDVVDAVVAQFAARFGDGRRRAAGRRVARAPRRPQRVHACRDARDRDAPGDAPVRLLGRLAEAGVPRRSTSPAHAPAGVDAGARRSRRRTSARRSDWCSSSTSTRCARRPGARTSTSAGPTTPRRS